MKGDLFDDVVDSSVRVGEHRWYSAPVSIVIHGVIVGSLILLPFVNSQVFPTVRSVLAFAPPPAPPGPPAPVIEVAPVTVSQIAELDLDAAPLEAPDRIADEPVPAGSAMGVPTLQTDVRAGADIALLPNGSATTLEKPRPAEPVDRSVLRVGGVIAEPRRIHHVAPVYPTIARAARREGTVTVEATIARDGRVVDARVLGPENIFGPAAVHAVRQWRYTVPTLNGVPVDVLMTVTVRFSLN